MIFSWKKHIRGQWLCIVTCMVTPFVEEPLEIIKPLKDQEIEEDQSFKFVCEVSKSNVKSRWHKDGKPITEKDGYLIETINTVHTLTLDNAMEEDGGKYSIKVEDKHSQATLTVKGANTLHMQSYFSFKLTIIIKITVKACFHILEPNCSFNKTFTDK